MEQYKPLQIAEAALARGDYSQCILFLTKIQANGDLPAKLDEQIQLLLITAYIGQGKEQKAIELCQNLLNNEESTIRQHAKYLLSIIKAPALSRPKDWSLQIPTFNQESSNETVLAQTKINSQKKSQPPSTGETKGLELGFTILVLAVLLLLTIFLSGCVRLTTEIQLTGPDKLNMAIQIESNSNELLPWQNQFTTSLKNLDSKINIQASNEGKQIIKTTPMNSEEANLFLKNIHLAASSTAALDLPPPQLNLEEKNLLVAVQQNFRISFDLKNLPDIPGFTMSIFFKPAPKSEKAKGSPLPVLIQDSNLHWELKQGVLNILEISQWRWNKLGIGTIIVTSILILVFAIQTLKIKMGYGFPELPP